MKIKTDKRLMIIFSLLVSAAILISVLIYFYQNRLDGRVRGDGLEAAACEKILDEDGCFAKDFCEGIYETTAGDNQTAIFKSCLRLDAKEEARLREEKNLCQKTKGNWHRNKLGNFCVCPNNGGNLVFDKSRGCVAK